MLKNRFIPSTFNPNSNRANLVWATALQVTEKVVGYLVIAILTRTLLQVELGTLFFALSIADLASVFLMFGSGTYLIRLIASDPENSVTHFSRILSSNILNIGIGYILLNLAVYFLRPEIQSVALLATAYNFLEKIYFSFSAFFIGKKQLLYRLIIMGGFKLAILVGVSLIAFLTKALFPVLWTHLFFNFLLVLTCYWIVHNQFGALKLRFSIRDNLGVMKASAPFFALLLLNMLHLRFDTIMVGLMLSLQQVAVYELGIKSLEVTRFFVRPITNVFLPVFSEYVAQGRWNLLRNRFLLLIGAALGVGLMLTIGMQIFGPRLIVLLFSEKYQASVIPTQILFLSVPFLFTVVLSTSAANAMHLENKVAVIAFISVALNIGLNLFVIPRFGIIGAAWATVISQAVQATGVITLVLPQILKKSSSA